MIYSGNVPNGRDITNLCRHEPVVMAKGAKILVVTGQGWKLSRDDRPTTPRRRRHRPTEEGASRRPYAEAHAQVVPTVLPAFQGSLSIHS